jgi:hypothetical protein
MKYDAQNRLIEEKITDPKGTGSIHYEYDGKRLTPRSAICSSTFYIKAKKKVAFFSEQ